MSLRLKIESAAPTGVPEGSDGPAWIGGRVKIAERVTDALPTFRSKSTGVPPWTGALVSIGARAWIGGQIRIAERSRRRAVQSVERASHPVVGRPSAGGA